MKRLKKNRKKRRRMTMTKRVTTALLIIGVIGGLLPYVLSMFDKQPVESMGIAWVTEIVAVCLGYFVRGYVDTNAEEKMKYERELNGLGMSDISEPEEPDVPADEEISG